MSIFSLWLYVLWCLASFIMLCAAQTSKLFQWGFENTALSTMLPTCTPLRIIVKSFNPTLNDTHGTPPYYMIAFVVGGAPVTTLIGTDEDNLSWTVTQPVGSQLVLSIVDANGSAGGIPPRLLTVIPGSTTQCVSTPLTTPEFKVTSNVTGDLSTCQPWGFSITGGVPPYTITLAAVNNPIVTNASIPFGNNHFTYINRADPGRQLIGAISDLTGRWATGTPIVNTQGSVDVSCTGLVSSSGDTATIQKQIDAANAAAVAARHRKSIVTGVSVTLVLLVLIGLGVFAFLYFRRRKKQIEIEDANAIPRQYVERGGVQILPINNSLSSLPNQVTSSKARLISSKERNMLPLSPPSPLSTAPSLDYQGSEPRSTNNQFSPPSFTNFPSTSIRRSAQAAEAGVLPIRAPDSQYLSTALSKSGSNVVAGANRPGLGLSNSRRPTVVSVLEERGGVLRESPPPYADKVGGGAGHAGR